MLKINCIRRTFNVIIKLKADSFTRYKFTLNKRIFQKVELRINMGLFDGLLGNATQNNNETAEKNYGMF